MPELLNTDSIRTAGDGVRPSATSDRLNQLQTLESESIYILREAVAEFAHPVLESEVHVPTRRMKHKNIGV